MLHVSPALEADGPLRGATSRSAGKRSLRARPALRLGILSGLAIGFWLLGALLHGSSASADAPPDPLATITAPVRSAVPVSAVVHQVHREVAKAVRAADTAVATNLPVTKPVTHLALAVQHTTSSVVTHVVRVVRHTTRPVVAPVVNPVITRVVAPVVTRVVAPVLGVGAHHPDAATHGVARPLPAAPVQRHLVPTTSRSPAAVSTARTVASVGEVAPKHHANPTTRSTKAAQADVHPARPDRAPMPTGWLPSAPTSTGDSGAARSSGSDNTALLVDRPRADSAAPRQCASPDSDSLPSALSARPSVSPD